MSAKQFVSTLIPLKETVSWTVHNISELRTNNAWTAMSIPMEVGFGATALSKWEISLSANSKVLHATARLVAPKNFRITHHLTIEIVRNGLPSLVKSSDYLKGKVAEVGGYSSYWKVIPLEDIDDPLTGIVTSEDSMQLNLTLTVFGSDVSQDRLDQYSTGV